MDRPTGWRKGETIFNFLEWLGANKSINVNQSFRLIDPFHISDEDWDKWYKEFLHEHP